MSTGDEHGLFVALDFVFPDEAGAISADSSGFGGRISAAGEHEFIVPDAGSAGGHCETGGAPELFPVRGIIGCDHGGAAEEELVFAAEFCDDGGAPVEGEGAFVVPGQASVSEVEGAEPRTGVAICGDNEGLAIDGWGRGVAVFVGLWAEAACIDFPFHFTAAIEGGSFNFFVVIEDHVDVFAVCCCCGGSVSVFGMNLRKSALADWGDPFGFSGAAVEGGDTLSLG